MIGNDSFIMVKSYRGMMCRENLQKMRWGIKGNPVLDSLFPLERRKMEYLTPAIQVALIIGLAEVIKRLGCPSKWIPLIDVVLGVISGVFVYSMYLGYDYVPGVVMGIVMGLTACGLFSGIKNTLEKS